jgi:cytochrome bd-type quinol oxidase subunit 2
VLVVVYGVFAVSAFARATVQISRDFSEAPVAYSLSAFAAVVYIVATVALARDKRRTATVAVLIELVGVIAVGVLSLVDTIDFPRATVWSSFGAGYGYVPLVLPMVGLWWIWRTRSTEPVTPAG